MDPETAQLSSIATALTDLTARVTELAERFDRTPREDLAAELLEVERSLQAAARRLGKVVDRLG